MYHYLNGRWVTTDNLKISAFDLSVTRGFGIFDFLRTYGEKPFMLDAHIDRFYKSAKILKIKPVGSKKEISKIVKEGIRKNHFENTNIKIIQTGGMSDDGITPNGQCSFIVMFTPATVYPKKYYSHGIKLITFPMGRIYTAAKSLNYMSGVLALQKAKEEKAVEVLYTDGKKIFECITSNFFAVINAKLVTAKKDILIGVTRNIVIQLAEKLGIKTEERDLFFKEIPRFQEAFISASNKEIMPVVKIDNKIINKGKVGEVTKKIMKEFASYTRSY